MSDKTDWQKAREEGEAYAKKYSYIDAQGIININGGLLAEGMKKSNDPTAFALGVSIYLAQHPKEINREDV